MLMMLMIIGSTDLSYRVVVTVPAQSEAVVLKNLSPNTQYQLSVTAVFRGHRSRSRQVIFRTLGEFTCGEDEATGIPRRLGEEEGEDLT